MPKITIKQAGRPKKPRPGQRNSEQSSIVPSTPTVQPTLPPNPLEYSLVDSSQLLHEDFLEPITSPSNGRERHSSLTDFTSILRNNLTGTSLPPENEQSPIVDNFQSSSNLIITSPINYTSMLLNNIGNNNSFSP